MIYYKCLIKLIIINYLKIVKFISIWSRMYNGVTTTEEKVEIGVLT